LDCAASRLGAACIIAGGDDTRRRRLRDDRAPACKAKRGMLNNLSAQIRDCHEHAEDCARKAAAQSDLQLKQDFLDLERRWLKLARSFELGERLTDFQAEARRRTDGFIGPK
jgi:hypothetical protein